MPFTRFVSALHTSEFHSNKPTREFKEKCTRAEKIWRLYEILFFVLQQTHIVRSLNIKDIRIKDL